MENYHEQSKIISKNDVEQLSHIFFKAWNKETTHPSVSDIWSSDNKALGQCAVTALVVNKLYGGDILDDNSHNHMWNLLPDGSQQDFSRSQFPNKEEFVITSTKSRNEVLNSDKSKLAKTSERYELLRTRINNITNQFNI